MTTNTNQPTNNQTQKSTTLIVTERFKLQSKSFRVTAYKLPDGKTTVTVRQMAITVRKQPKTAKDFLKRLGISPITARMPNCCVADMVYLPTVIDYFRDLNESGRGNIRTLLGQEFLTKHLLEEEAKNNR
ncbi:hypothetical protein DSM106972_047030 [Dulcicalothrix desertica PCC 7102]|uniref:Uncharacterized protein n=1 Tax=Dulcicalothrix desertica PCC 7102 TaxID=232991 RepID=A0A433VCN9_9CYAN|nr:hypothetical protein [Dulcicalothrix desertica]RUT03789.1 hypothetical protein DSM106972_047030 [Dulcicalothrix desertica PCC 7102]TWH43803.1 hypothetical protein CAL7102_07547 [Dulcicalothrix desertica PCC 7102]